MAKLCPLTGKRPMVGNTVSHANNKTLTRKFPNLQSKSVYVASRKKWVTLRLSTRALRTLDKYGWDVDAVARKFKELKQWI